MVALDDCFKDGQRVDLISTLAADVGAWRCEFLAANRTPTLQVRPGIAYLKGAIVEELSSTSMINTTADVSGRGLRPSSECGPQRHLRFSDGREAVNVAFNTFGSKSRRQSDVSMAGLYIQRPVENHARAR